MANHEFPPNDANLPDDSALPLAIRENKLGGVREAEKKAEAEAEELEFDVLPPESKEEKERKRQQMAEGADQLRQANVTSVRTIEKPEKKHKTSFGRKAARTAGVLTTGGIVGFLMAVWRSAQAAMGKNVKSGHADTSSAKGH